MHKSIRQILMVIALVVVVALVGLGALNVLAQKSNPAPAPKQYPIAVASVQKVAVPAYQALQVSRAKEETAAAEEKAAHAVTQLRQSETRGSERDYFDALNVLKKEAGIPAEDWDKYDLTSDDGNRTFAFAVKPAPATKQQ